MPGKHVWSNALDKAMAYESIRMQRHMCCDPYDCMCHEMCNPELGYCDSCKRMEYLYSELLRYCAKRNVDLRKVWIEADNMMKNLGHTY